jgi:diguanylate cyclase (GGDEF)-like protein
MFLDPQTLLIINVVNLLTLAALLPLMMGGTLSQAAQHARQSLIIHALAWICVILSEQVAALWLNLVLSVASMTCYGLSNLRLFRALEGWLGPRPGKAFMLILALMLPVGYAGFFLHYSWRVGWANLLIALQIALLALATRQPRTALSGRWRHVLLICFAIMAALTLGRGIVGFFDPAAYPSFAAPHPVNLLALLVSNISMVLGNVCVLVAWREEAELQLRNQAETDPLTTLLNRRGWEAQSETGFANARRYRQLLALLLLDLDHFKQVNDRYGHEVGDAALRLFGKLLHQQRRSGDIVARFGGEEFTLLLPMGDLEAARSFDSRLRTLLLEQSQHELGFALNYSAGLACLDPAQDCSVAALLHRADEALYRAKAEGRGRLILAG